YKYRKLMLREAINFISDTWDDVNDITIKNCWKTTRIMPKASESNEYKEEEVEDLLIENNSEVQELINNIEKYTHLIDQPVITEDALTDKEIIEMATETLEKVKKFQESFKVGKGFNEKELK
ncbi:28125_t:CDS:2, partial [Racocetra persica]